MRKDGWTDMTKTKDAFGDYVNAPSKISLKVLLQKYHSFNRKSFKFSKLFVGALFTSEAMQPILNKQLTTKNEQFSASLDSFLSEGIIFLHWLTVPLIVLPVSDIARLLLL